MYTHIILFTLSNVIHYQFAGPMSRVVTYMPPQEVFVTGIKSSDQCSLRADQVIEINFEWETTNQVFPVLRTHGYTVLSTERL